MKIKGEKAFTECASHLSIGTTWWTIEAGSEAHKLFKGLFTFVRCLNVPYVRC